MRRVQRLAARARRKAQQVTPRAKAFASAWAKKFGPYVSAGGLAAQVQAAAAVFAVWYAVSTVNNWKEQEITKKRSEIAFDIMSRTAATRGIMEPIMRYRNVIEDRENFYGSGNLMMIYKGPVRARVTGMKEKLAELEVLESVASFTFKNADLTDAIDGVNDGVRALSYCLDRLERLDSMPEEDRSDKWKGDVKKILAAVQVYETSEDAVKDTESEDYCGVESAYDYAETVEQMLQPELKMVSRLAEKETVTEPEPVEEEAVGSVKK